MLQTKAFSSSHLMVPLTLPLFFILIKQTVHHLQCSSVTTTIITPLPISLKSDIFFSLYPQDPHQYTHTHTQTFLMFHTTWYLGNYRMQEANTHEWAMQMSDRRTLSRINFTTRIFPWICKTAIYEPSKKVRLLHNINIKRWEDDIKNVSSRSCLVYINHSVSYVQEMSKMKQFFFHLIFQNEWYVIHVVMGELLVLDNHKKNIYSVQTSTYMFTHTYISLPTKEHWSKRYS